MPSFNVLLEIYGEKKHMIYLKAQIFFSFSEALSMWNPIANKYRDNSER